MTMTTSYKFPAASDVFLLKDANGCLRGVLHTDEEGTPAFRLLDSEGNAKVELTITPDGVGSIVLYDKDGNPYFQMP